MADKYQPQQRTHSTWLTNINPNRELTQHGCQISTLTENSLNMMAAEYQPQQRTLSTWLPNISPNGELTSPEYNGPGPNNLSRCIVAQTCQILY